ncbi:hotdog fold thioesterase [Kibdelosporangium philippinense]|uniref:Hotdog fold thioesterase n=1 Tax=Kibdelosporangium philippinense TaxID=211113 RepID=A0ABS8Z1P3_9PSEU|nr:hotdog fold thioesterase [Kibdelosporangium philippinense]MCE7001680.1 hotdog fold thioesterase [Kibdelosporangium philippinense]
MGELVEQLNEKMGIEVTDWTPDRVVATMPVKGNRQPYGLLHGGANAVLAEAVGSVCAALKSDGKPTVGLELSCTHHRGVREGLVTAVATPLHVGRSTVTVEIVITDESDRRTCTARLTCMVLQNVPGS